jgi:phosphoheptose isomerase
MNKASNYLIHYQVELARALATVDHNALNLAYDLILNHMRWEAPIYSIGNGGSAAIAEHMACDHSKGVAFDTTLSPHVQSLLSTPMITAIANDLGYEKIFSFQIETLTHDECLIVAISSSGNSPNIVNALETANRRNMSTIAFVGFDGGEVVKRNLADIIIHVKSNNYGIVEDTHQMLMHVLAQTIRKNHSTHPETMKL